MCSKEFCEILFPFSAASPLANDRLEASVRPSAWIYPTRAPSPGPWAATESIGGD